MHRGVLRAVSMFAAVVLLAAAGPGYDPQPYLHAQRLVDVGGRRMNVSCVGNGAPVVVLDAGLGGSAFDWRRVQQKIALHTRVCAYDRAGMGFSDPAPAPRDADAVVRDLHALLQRAAIAPPYVLVGHSLGGMHVRLFADRYPREVAGMVLVDPATEDQDVLFHRLSPGVVRLDVAEVRMHKDCAAAAARGELRDGTRAFKECGLPDAAQIRAACREQGPQVCALARLYVQQHQSARYWNELALEAAASGGRSSNQVRVEQRDYGSMPLIVLTAGRSDGIPIPKREQILVWNAWKQMHDRVAALSSRGANVVVPGSGHFIQFDKPAAVVSAVEKVVHQVRAAARPSSSQRASRVSNPDGASP
jgi:pimeloyl-ACP methyl ester carboxylesterase